MADRGDTHYHVPNLNTWFLFSSLLLLLTVVWTVIDDWNAEWKDYQREFRRIELAKAQAQLEAMEADGALAQEDELKQAVDEAQARLDQRRAELEQLETETYRLKEERAAIEEEFKKAKAVENWDKYVAEEHVLEGEVDHAEADRELDPKRLHTLELEAAFEDATRVYEESDAKLADLRSGVADAEKALAASARDLERVRSRIEQLDPSDPAFKLANAIRDFPGLDFIGPNLKVQKQVLSDLTFELNFTKKTRIDMCSTCHLGIDREGFGDVVQPFTTHPRLDLYLTSKSPHPVKDVGCTICHRGSGESLSFQHTDHRPSDDAEREQWEKEYHWHKQHHWDYPMLKSEDIEASCVQCHQTSMELIAADAPRVTEGYRLFERYGCYACHKVDWFPTSRKPGPSLKNLAAKVRPEFVDAWITKPKAFRPTTWMPQIFHLDNFAPDEVVVKSNYGEGEAILGETWNDTAVAAVTSYLFENHPLQPLEPIPVEGDAARGREVFRLVGCLACHNTAPYPGREARYPDLAFQVNETNAFGPNLRGVASKVDRRWLYHWLKDPKSYWEETRMPNLRLSDQDAADVTAYLMDDPDGVFHDVPDGWAEGRSEADTDTLREQARWFFQKLGRRQLEARLAGEDPEHPWDDPSVLEVAVGEAFVRNQGCFSCHLIGGMETDMPIGTELSNWGSKTVDKLDFAMAYRTEIALPGEAERLPELDEDYREGWLERKLLHPRSYDAGKLKNPKEKLRMPQFGFTDEQAGAIATFVLGLVDDEVQRAKMIPTPEQLSMDQGMRVVRQRNCTACHVVDPGQVTFEHDGSLVTVPAEILPFEGDTLPPPMDGKAALDAAVASWEDYEGDELEEFVLRLLGPAPDVGAPSESVIVPKDALVDVTPAHGGNFVRNVTDYYFFGTNVPDPEAAEDEDPFFPWTFGYDEDADENLIEDVDGEQRAYSNEEYDKIRWTFAPPVLWNEGHKLQRDWFYAFLQDPIPLRKQIRVRMPSFHFEKGEAESVADYFAYKAIDEWYPRYARTMRLVLGRDLRDAVKDESAHGWPLDRADQWPIAMHMKESGPGLPVAEVAEGSGLSAATVHEIEDGSAAAVSASFDKLATFGADRGFAMAGPVSPSYERVERRAPSYLAAREHFLALGEAVATEGVNCFQCHPRDGQYPETPIAWAPDLGNVRERLREDWVREWLWSPRLVYPGTAMPDNFSADEPQYQDAYPNSSNADQIQAVMDWLYNLDRAPANPD